MEQALVQVASDERLIGLFLYGRSERTQREYARDLARLQDYLAKPLREVTLADLQDFAMSLTGLALTSRARVLATAKSLWSFGFKLGYFPFNVGAALRVAKGPDKLAERILPPEDVERMIATTSGRNRLILEVLYDTALRVSEVCSLCWHNLQSTPTGGAIVFSGKGSKARVVALSPRVYGLLHQARGNQPPQAAIFPSRKGTGHLDPSMVWRIVCAAARAAGIEGNVSPHWLRHSCASNAIYGGAPVQLVQQQLGHADLKTTGKYLHVRPGDALGNYLRRNE
jgi:integrase/recombinase XerD